MKSGYARRLALMLPCAVAASVLGGERQEERDALQGEPIARERARDQGGTPALLARDDPRAATSHRLTVRVVAFEDGGRIPLTYSDYGEKISPELHWSDAPEGTRSFVIIMEDPDADDPRPFVHWLLYNLPAGANRLRMAVPEEPRLPRLHGALQGLNSRGSVGYFGPRPPPGSGVHHYHIQVLALDGKLDVKPGARKEELLSAIDGRVLAGGTVMGAFEKRTDDRVPPSPARSQSGAE